MSIKDHDQQAGETLKRPRKIKRNDPHIHYPFSNLL